MRHLSLRNLAITACALAGCIFGAHQGVVAEADLNNAVSGRLATTRSGLVVAVNLEGVQKQPTLKVFDDEGELIASKSVSSFAATCNANFNQGCTQLVALTEDDTNNGDSFLVLFNNGVMWRGIVDIQNGTIGSGGTPARLGEKAWTDAVLDATKVVPMEGAGVYSKSNGACANGLEPQLAWSKGRGNVGFNETPISLRPQLGCNINNLRVALDHQSGKFAVLGGNKVAIFAWNAASGAPSHERTVNLTASGGFVYTDLAMEYGQLVVSERRTTGGLSRLYTLPANTGVVQSIRTVREAYSTAFSYTQGDGAYAWYNGSSTDQAYRIGRFPLYAD